MAAPSTYGTSADQVTESNITGTEVIQGIVMNPRGGILGQPIQAVQTVAGAALASSTTATSLLGTMVGSLVLQPSELVVGSTFRVKASGTINDTSTPTFSLIVALGSTAITTASGTLVAITSGPTRWVAESTFTIAATGASGSVLGEGSFTYHSTTILAVTLQSLPATVSVNLASPITLGVTGTWGTSSSSNTITCTNFFYEQLY